MVNYLILKSVATATQAFRKGEVHRLDDAVGNELVEAGIAERTDRHPAYAEQLLARLDAGAGRECLFLPFVGEFGHLIMSHVRLVHFHRANRKVVCCRPGEEALYPTADAFEYRWADPVPDKLRVGTMAHMRLHWTDLKRLHPNLYPIEAGGLSRAQEIYPIHPEIEIPVKASTYGHRADVVIGIRQREFAVEKNWLHWGKLAKALKSAGITYAVVGAKDTSYDLPGQVCRTNGDVGMAIELLQSCKLYVGTDSGNSHLAAMIATPSILFRENVSGMRDMIPRMRETNPNIDVVAGGWDEPQSVIDAVVGRVSGKSPTTPPAPKPRKRSRAAATEKA